MDSQEELRSSSSELFEDDSPHLDWTLALAGGEVPESPSEVPPDEVPPDGGEKDEPEGRANPPASESGEASGEGADPAAAEDQEASEEPADPKSGKPTDES